MTTKSNLFFTTTFFGLLAIVMGVSNWSKQNSIDTLQAELNKPKLIREYVDLNSNGEYEVYRVLVQSKDGKENSIPDSMGWEIRFLSFYGPFGGEVHEAPRELLNTMFTDYNYPSDVNRIRFSSN